MSNILGSKLAVGAGVVIHQVYTFLIVQEKTTMAGAELREDASILDREGGFLKVDRRG